MTIPAWLHYGWPTLLAAGIILSLVWGMSQPPDPRPYYEQECDRKNLEIKKRNMRLAKKRLREQDKEFRRALRVVMKRAKGHPYTEWEHVLEDVRTEIADAEDRPERRRGPEGVEERQEGV